VCVNPSMSRQVQQVLVPWCIAKCGIRWNNAVSSSYLVEFLRHILRSYIPKLDQVEAMLSRQGNIDVVARKLAGSHAQAVRAHKEVMSRLVSQLLLSNL
jgi:hypothetical protein